MHFGGNFKKLETLDLTPFFTLHDTSRQFTQQHKPIECKNIYLVQHKTIYTTQANKYIYLVQPSITKIKHKLISTTFYLDIER